MSDLEMENFQLKEKRKGIFGENYLQKQVNIRVEFIKILKMV